MGTADGRYIVVDGRRWRATDPQIPDRLKAELVAELMAARRAVGVARRSGDSVAEQCARGRVGDAKLALGERGAPWWDDDDADAESFRRRARATARTLLRHRATTSSICPSDVSRVVGGPSWRDRTDDVRSALLELASCGQVAITRGAASVESFAGGQPTVDTIAKRLRQLAT